MTRGQRKRAEQRAQFIHNAFEWLAALGIVVFGYFGIIALMAIA